MPDAFGNATFDDYAALQQAQQEANAQARSDNLNIERAKLDSAYRIAQLSANNAAETNRIQAAYNKARLALDAKELQLKAEIERGQLALSQGEQRIGVSEALAKMTGPENVFDQMAFLRGVGSTGDLPPAYRNMKLGLDTPFFQANPGMAAPTAPVPVEKQGIWQALRSEAPPAEKQGAGGIDDVLAYRSNAAPLAPLSPALAAATSPTSPFGRLPADTDRVRAFARTMGLRGPQSWAPQSVEMMLPDEQLAFWSALGKEGFSVPSMKELYLRSRFSNDQSPLLA